MLCTQTMQLLLLEFAIFVWKQVPYIGLAAEPVVSSLLLHTCLAALQPCTFIQTWDASQCSIH